MTKNSKNKALTAEEQAKLTPGKVIEVLRQGNVDFINNRLTVMNNMERVREVVNGQFPMAVILSCLDSRVPVEDIFHCGLGDLFVARVAGNVVNTDILGSMEYACSVLGAKLIVVLGHENCGAIVSAIAGFELGHFSGVLNKIKPTVKKCQIEYAGEATPSEPLFVKKVCLANIAQMVTEIRMNSPVLKAMEENGNIKITGAYYDLHNGEVAFL